VSPESLTFEARPVSSSPLPSPPVYAVIRDRNRNYTVRPGDEIRIDLREDLAPGAEIAFEAVVVGEGPATRVGRPTVPGVKVLGDVRGPAKGEKIVVYRWRHRHGFRKKTGHRQKYLAVRIREIRTE
jgi:large subunit ribosomal protein L21